MNQFDFIKIINPFKDKLFRLAKRLLVSTEEAEDATQEILVKLWNKNDGLEKYNSNIGNNLGLRLGVFGEYKLNSKFSFAPKTELVFDNNEYKAYEIIDSISAKPFGIWFFNK